MGKAVGDAADIFTLKLMLCTQLCDFSHIDNTCKMQFTLQEDLLTNAETIITYICFGAFPNHSGVDT